MTLLKILFYAIFFTVALSWGWGMRGTAIGGEKGAMLPGALLGLSFAAFCGTEQTTAHYYIFAAAGAVGMYIGGHMTYGETLGLSMNSSPAPELKKGLAGVFVKGGAWFSACWGCLFMTLSLVSHLVYDIWDVVAFFVILPVLALSFTFIFNRPYKPSEGKFPRVYFSKTRKETWGTVLAFTCDFLIISAINNDRLTFVMTVAGFAVGGTGWVIAQLAQIRTKYPFRNGKYIFNPIHKFCMDSWKLMECMLGGFCGLGMAVCSAILMPHITERLTAAEWYGFGIFISKDTDRILGIVYLCLIALDSVQYLIRLKKTKSELDKMYSLSLLSKEEYEREAGRAVIKQNKAVDIYNKICRAAELPLYCVIPMLFIFLGSHETAKLVSFGVIFIVLSQEVSEKLLNGIKNQRLWEFFLYMIPLCISVLQFTCGYTPDIFLTICVYTALYEAIFLVKRVWEFSLQKQTDSLRVFFSNGMVTHTYFCICCIALMTATIFIK